jgi:hypothetical protein
MFDRYRDTKPPPGWQPKSRFFKWVWARAEVKHLMAEQTNSGAEWLARCGNCDTAFFMHGERRWCPACGTDGEPVVVLAAIEDLVNLLAEKLLHDPAALIGDRQEEDPGPAPAGADSTEAGRLESDPSPGPLSAGPPAEPAPADGGRKRSQRGGLSPEPSEKGPGSAAAGAGHSAEDCDNVLCPEHGDPRDTSIATPQAVS